MFFVVRSKDSFNFLLRLIKYIVIVTVIHGGCMDTVESALEVDSGGKNPLPHRGLKPASVLRLAI